MSGEVPGKELTVNSETEETCCMVNGILNVHVLIRSIIPVAHFTNMD